MTDEYKNDQTSQPPSDYAEQLAQPWERVDERVSPLVEFPPAPYDAPDANVPLILRPGDDYPAPPLLPPPLPWNHPVVSHPNPPTFRGPDGNLVGEYRYLTMKHYKDKKSRYRIRDEDNQLKNPAAETPIDRMPKPREELWRDIVPWIDNNRPYLGCANGVVDNLPDDTDHLFDLCGFGGPKPEPAQPTHRTQQRKKSCLKRSTPDDECSPSDVIVVEEPQADRQVLPLPRRNASPRPEPTLMQFDCPLSPLPPTTSNSPTTSTTSSSQPTKKRYFERDAEYAATSGPAPFLNASQYASSSGSSNQPRPAKRRRDEEPSDRPPVTSATAAPSVANTSPPRRSTRSDDVPPAKRTRQVRVEIPPTWNGFKERYPKPPRNRRLDGTPTGRRSRSKGRPETPEEAHLKRMKKEEKARKEQRLDERATLRLQMLEWYEAVVLREFGVYLARVRSGYTMETMYLREGAGAYFHDAYPNLFHTAWNGVKVKQLEAWIASSVFEWQWLEPPFSREKYDGMEELVVEEAIVVVDEEIDVGPPASEILPPELILSEDADVLEDDEEEAFQEALLSAEADVEAAAAVAGELVFEDPDVEFEAQLVAVVASGSAPPPPPPPSNGSSEAEEALLVVVGAGAEEENESDDDDHWSLATNPRRSPAPSPPPSDSFSVSFPVTPESSILSTTVEAPTSPPPPPHLAVLPIIHLAHHVLPPLRRSDAFYGEAMLPMRLRFPNN